MVVEMKCRFNDLTSISSFLLVPLFGLSESELGHLDPLKVALQVSNVLVWIQYKDDAVAQALVIMMEDVIRQE
jgi:hypothetical protein